MKARTFNIEGPILIEPRVFGDDRGYFYESYHAERFNKAAGRTLNFVQDNQSFSATKGTIRGLHYQSPPHAQAKLVRCLSGSIIDIIVDVRTGSPTFGQHIRVELTSENHHQLFVPEGFLHGFSTQTPNALVSYKVTDVYAPDCDGAVMWNSPALDLDWAVPEGAGVLSKKDSQAPDFKDWVSPFSI